MALVILSRFLETGLVKSTEDLTDLWYNIVVKHVLGCVNMTRYKFLADLEMRLGCMRRYISYTHSANKVINKEKFGENYTTILFLLSIYPWSVPHLFLFFSLFQVHGHLHGFTFSPCRIFFASTFFIISSYFDDPILPKYIVRTNEATMFEA